MKEVITMRATGIIRRIDDLGRVVIPKEIRRNLRIKEGDPLEIYTERDTVCFKRYNPYGEADWKKALAVVGAVIPKGVDYALFDRDLDRQATSKAGVFADNAETIDAEFLATIKDDENEVIGYLAVNDEEFEPSTAVKVLSAFLSDNF